MRQGLADAPFRSGLRFSIELLVTQGGASLDDLEVGPVVVFKYLYKKILVHQEIPFLVQPDKVHLKFL
jgi:hypothetical protein